MTKHFRRFLTNAELERRGRRYEGVISCVTLEQVHNRFKLSTQEEPMIAFADGWCWVPNFGARRLLSDKLGEEADGWVGRRIAITLEGVARVEKASGRGIERLEKRVAVIE